MGVGAKTFLAFVILQKALYFLFVLTHFTKYIYKYICICIFMRMYANMLQINICLMRTFFGLQCLFVQTCNSRENMFLLQKVESLNGKQSTVPFAESGGSLSRKQSNIPFAESGEKFTLTTYSFCRKWRTASYAVVEEENKLILQQSFLDQI